MSKHIHVVALGMCHNPPLIRDKPLGVPASVKLVYWLIVTAQAMQEAKWLLQRLMLSLFTNFFCNLFVRPNMGHIE